MNRLKSYVTTPIFYPNAAPHLGHLYSMLLCDVRNRWEQLKGSDTFFTTGTDEHGLKIQAAAQLRNLEPQKFVDELSLNFKLLAAKADIKYDRFIRTTDEDHVRAVKHFWNKLLQRGYIYKGDHQGYYSVSDETFYPPSQIYSKDGEFFSTETNTKVVLTSESNYFFKLSSFQEKLISHLKANPKWITPKQKHQELLTELQNAKLEDLSISRPSKRLQWGISVPEDDEQKIYVWIDALVNYLTSVGYPDANDFWPFATHLIGKDIIRFHCIYWPCLLMANNIQLPQKVVVHGHWLSEGTKMSKSKGNVIDPLALIDGNGQDATRFFLSENSVLNGDNNFSQQSFQKTVDALVDKYSNLVMRSCGKKFNIERSLAKFDQLENHQFGNPVLQSQFDELKLTMNLLFEKMDYKMVDFNTAHAIQEFWYLINKTNQFIQDSEPWSKSHDTDSKDAIILIAAESVRIASILIQPVIPQLANKVLDRLNVNVRSLDAAQFGKDLTYGTGANRSGDYPIQRVK